MKAGRPFGAPSVLACCIALRATSKSLLCRAEILSRYQKRALVGICCVRVEYCVSASVQFWELYALSAATAAASSTGDCANAARGISNEIIAKLRRIMKSASAHLELWAIVPRTIQHAGVD